MPEYLSPGVYVEEVSTGPKPISFAPTSVTGFVGFAQKGPFNKPTLVTNWTQFVQKFGSFTPGTFLAYAVYGFFQEGGSRCYVLRIGGEGKSADPTAASLPLGALRIFAKTPGAVGRQISVMVDKGETDDKITVTIKKADQEEKFTNVTLQEAINQINEKSQFVKAEVDPAGNNALPAPSPKGKSSNLMGGSGSAADVPVSSTNIGPIKFSATVGGMEANTTTARLFHPEEIGNKVPFGQLVIERGKKTEKFNNVNLDDPASIVDLINNGNEQMGISASELVRAELSGSSDPIVPKLYYFTGVSLAKAKDFTGDKSLPEHTGFDAFEEFEDISIVCCPDLMAGVRLVNGKVHPDDLEMIKNVQTAMIAHCEKMHYRVAVLDAPPNMNPQELRAWRRGEQEFKGTGANYDSDKAALYYPWIKIADPVSGKQIPAPPSAYMAGIYGRNDQNRGVHKAPANEVIRSAVGVVYNCTKGENDVLYGSESCNVNVIREFPGRGIRVWGARTLASDPEWKYLNVRRLFNMVEKSVGDSTHWTVFEPNDFDLWQRLKRDVSAFLTICWREGMLFGRTAGESFFVKCDEETNPRELIDQGRLTCEIGICPSKPAEFVVFRIGQWDGGTSVAE